MKIHKELDSYQTFFCINIQILTNKDATVTDPSYIANIVNACFSLTTEKTKANIKFSNKLF